MFFLIYIYFFSKNNLFFVRKNGWEFVFGVDFCPKMLKQKKFMNQ